jgi:hypothetical protein
MGKLLTKFSKTPVKCYWSSIGEQRGTPHRIAPPHIYGKRGEGMPPDDLHLTIKAQMFIDSSWVLFFNHSKKLPVENRKVSFCIKGLIVEKKFS